MESLFISMAVVLTLEISVELVCGHAHMLLSLDSQETPLKTYTDFKSLKMLICSI